MKNFFISVAFGLLGIALFFLGAASSGSGFFVISLDDVQLNQWAVVVQFFGYFLLALISLAVRNRFIKN
jgi:hypothetical protein